MKRRGVDTLYHPGASVWDLLAMAVAPSADMTSSVPEGALVQPNDPRERLDWVAGVWQLPAGLATSFPLPAILKQGCQLPFRSDDSGEVQSLLVKGVSRRSLLSSSCSSHVFEEPRTRTLMPVWFVYLLFTRDQAQGLACAGPELSI